jgi:FlaA1/EpsC-like NDP-sugar epimerase
MLYNTGLFGFARYVLDVTLLEVFLAYLLFIYVLYNNGAYRKKRDFAGIQRLKSVIKGVLQAVVIYIVLAYTIKYQIPRIIVCCLHYYNPDNSNFFTYSSPIN